MLSPYRVVEIAHERGMLCGQILADLGADVIQIEPPGGSVVRRRPPFFKDEPGTERSLVWWACARNKRGLVLDLEREAGRSAFRRLIEGADFLVEAEDPGALDPLGLGRDDLAALNPGLVHVSITPFGSDGPKADWAETDLIMMAAGGQMALTGDEDRAPLRITVPQAYAHAAAEAASAALIAHHERRRSGRGQHVDVSIQQAVTMITLGAVLGPALGSPEIQRIASGIRVGDLRLRTIFEAKDGWVLVIPAATPAVAGYMTRLLQWLVEEGLCDEAYRDQNWGAFGIEVLIGQRDPSELDAVIDLLARFVASKTKRELLEGALERKLLIAPVMTIAELVDSDQAVARESVVPVRHCEPDREVRYPGPFARFSRTPVAYRRGPPRLGEHSREVLVDTLGCSEAEFEALRAAGVTA